MAISDIGAVLIWWTIIQGLGWAVWPLVFRWLAWLPDRGYMLAKPLGLLLASYAFWLLVSLRVLPNTLFGVGAAVVLVALLSWWLYVRRRGQDSVSNSLRSWLTTQRRLVLAYEALFALAFIGWILFRVHNPDISSAEKPMEFAFFNATGRSASFPPHDPWLSGHPIAYYYFGYVMMSVLTKLSGVGPGVAFSLSNAMWFALAAASVCSVVGNLVLLVARQARRSAAIFGVLGAVMLMVMGNLEAPLDLAYTKGWGSAQFWAWLDILELNQPYTPPATAQFNWLPRANRDWWWRASRVINDYPPDYVSPQLAAVLGLPRDYTHPEDTVIDEFPQFSFILGDMHPHVLNLPFVLVAIGAILNLFQAELTDRPRRAWQLTLWPLYPLLLGALGFMNTWDFPIYTFLACAARWLAGYLKPGAATSRSALRTGFGKAVLDFVFWTVLGIGLYLPFYLTFTSQVSGIAPNYFNGTRLPQFFVMFGPFLIIGGLFMLYLIWQLRRIDYPGGATLGWKAVGGGILIVGVMTAAAVGLGFIVFNASPDLYAWLEELQSAMTAREITLGAHALVRVLNPWVPLLLATALASILLLWRARRSFAPDQQSAVCQPANFTLLLLGLGCLLALGAEFFFVVDVFKMRMNTVFKFYYQVWVLWSVASAFALYYLLAGPARLAHRGRRRIIAGLAAILISLGLLYPIFAIPTRAAESPTPMLDALKAATQSTLYPNAYKAYDAVQWLNQNVPGTPIILEGIDAASEFNAARGRVASWTGMPTVLGWPRHEIQWRGNDTEVNKRLTDIETIYSTTDAGLALSLLRRYGVEYVYVGGVERRLYPAAGLAKFDRSLPLIYQRHDISIYQVPPDPSRSVP